MFNKLKDKLKSNRNRLNQKLAKNNHNRKKNKNYNNRKRNKNYNKHRIYRKKLMNNCRSSSNLHRYIQIPTIQSNMRNQ